MDDRPILFSGPMVRAILDGQKTQTRRVLKLPTKGEYVRPDMGGWTPTINGGTGVFRVARDGSRSPVPETVGIWNQTTGRCLDAPYQIGDRLWVREHWQAFGEMDGLKPSDMRPTADLLYIADRPDTRWNSRLRQGMHMPRWASRLTLIVTDVRVQRLQDITNENCIAEGIPLDPNPHAPRVGPVQDEFARQNGLISHYGAQFQKLWNSINAKRNGGAYAWAANPWVVAVSFRAIKQNIDEVPA